MKKLLGRAATIASAGASLYLGASYVLSRVLAKRLISPTGLGPAPGRHEDLLAALETGASATVVANLRHRGSPRLPVELAATFASPEIG